MPSQSRNVDRHKTLSSFRCFDKQPRGKKINQKSHFSKYDPDESRDYDSKTVYSPRISFRNAVILVWPRKISLLCEKIPSNASPDDCVWRWFRTGFKGCDWNLHSDRKTPRCPRLHPPPLELFEASLSVQRKDLLGQRLQLCHPFCAQIHAPPSPRRLLSFPS